MSASIRVLCITALASAALALSACGGTEDGIGDPDAGDATGDTGGADSGRPDGGEDTSTDTPDSCESGFTCSTRVDCGESGLANAQCLDGCCVAGTGASCQSALSPCTSSAESNEDYFCDTAAGVCLQRCNLASADRTQSDDCPLSSYCLGEDPEAENPDFDLDLDGLCIPGDCDTNIFDAEACEGVGTCLPIGNGASYCITAGTAAEGDACGRITGDNRPASDACRPGLLCITGECVAPCDRRSGDADCDAGEVCLAALDTTPRNQPGLCGVACEPFSLGECGENETCEPRLGRTGINTWMCTDLGDGTVVAVGDDCTDEDVVCGEGALCVSVTETTARCLQACDPLGASSGAGAICDGGGAAGDMLIPAIGFEGASAYRAFTAGEHAVQVRTEAGALVRAATVQADAGVVATMVATTDGTALSLFTIDDLTATSSVPETGLRFVHAATGVDPVDVYLLSLLFADVAVGAPMAWETLDAGAQGFNGVWAGFVGGNAYRVAQVGDSFVIDDAVTPEQAGALATGEAGVRFFHGVVGGPAVDIYVGCPDNESTFADCFDIAPIVTELEAGDFDDGGDFMPVPAVTTSGETFYVVVSDADPSDFAASDVLQSGTLPTLTVGALYQATAFSTGEGVGIAVDRIALPALGTTITVTFQNLSDDATLDLVWESGPIGEEVAFGEALDVNSTGYLDLMAGFYAFGFDLDGDDAIRLELDELEDGERRTVFAAIDAEDALTTFTTDDDLTPPSAGEGHVRLVHAAGGQPNVMVNAIAVVDQACTPSRVAGYGFCQESCEPYPRRAGDYGCDEDNQTCLPFVTRSDRPTLPQGYCASAGSGTALPGDSCDNPGYLGGDCADYNVCLITEEGGSATCLALCEPLSSGQCAAFADSPVCSPVPPLLGSLELSFCSDAQPGQRGQACSEPGIACADDGTLCIGPEGQSTCERVCRQGLGDCDDIEGTCETGLFDPAVVPSYMGLCR